MTGGRGAGGVRSGRGLSRPVAPRLGRRGGRAGAPSALGRR
ncbi:hypothetical protein HMPREF0043_02153, partial [Actinobaculum sp. oral taxon 183 str. F0552]